MSPALFKLVTPWYSKQVKSIHETKICYKASTDDYDSLQQRDLMFSVNSVWNSVKMVILISVSYTYNIAKRDFIGNSK